MNRPRPGAAFFIATAGGWITMGALATEVRSMSAPTEELLAQALARRSELIAELEQRGTDCYRVFHGTVEGRPGLTVDRYGEVLLAQSFHAPLDAADLAGLGDACRQLLPGLELFYNDRSGRGSRIGNALEGDALLRAETPRVINEDGVRHHFRVRHEGQDPWLFLDLRAARRRVAELAAGRSLLNLFAYTCGVGTVAAKAGASFVVNVDFSASALRIGRDNARLNELPIRPRFVHSDVFPALRQYAGIGQPAVVRGKRMPPFPRLEPRRFELVLLDPPRYAKSPFGVVDLVRDYPALFKPALLATAEGGTLICCNNAAELAEEAWLDQLLRSADKAGRPLREVEWIRPDADFPSFDGRPPLKIVQLAV